MTSRRSFLGGAAAGAAALRGAALSGAAIADDPGSFKLGVATYSLKEFSRALAIKILKDLKVTHVSIKEFHLLYRSTPEELAKGRAEFQKAGFTIASGGNISLPNDDMADMKKYFEYAKMCGMPMIVCAPTHANVPKLEALVKEYNIKAAIHNHGPEDKHFPTPQSVLEAVKGRDPRLGLCMDLGHSARTGVDVVKSLAEAGPRLLDVHIKDLKNLMDKGSQCDVGEGAMPIVEIFKQLKKLNYTGCVNLEYEINMDAPQVGMQKSLAYMRGVAAGLKG